jgi:phage anti-repressor protein
MNQKFSRKELERLGCTESQVELVMECQKKLPVIFENDEIATFCVDARKLWSELESKRKFSDWINQKIIKCKITEDIDYIAFSQKCEKLSGGRPTDEYMLTMRIAQHFCMLQNNDIGFKMRDYYILMEDIVKRNKKWTSTRNPQKANYIPMCQAYSESIHRICGRYGDDNDFKVEANRLNIIATGSKAQSIKNYLGIL